MTIKRVILANGSRLLREILHRAIEKAEQLEVVREIPGWEELPSALETSNPAWVIIPQPYGIQSHSRISSWMAKYPSVRFVFLSPSQDSVKMIWKISHEEDYSNLSLKDLIQLLETDLQPT